MAEIDELDEIEDEEGKEYWRQSEMQAQMLAGENATVEIWRDQAIKLDKLAEAIAESPAAWYIVDKVLRKHHKLLVDESEQDWPAGSRIE